MTRIKLQVGNENFGRGLTTVVLETDGSIHVVNVRRLEVKKRLTESALTSMAAQAMGHAQAKDIFRLKNPRVHGIPDEARYKIEIEGAVLEVWDGDLSQNPQLAVFVSALRDLVDKSTNGEVAL